MNPPTDAHSSTWAGSSSHLPPPTTRGGETVRARSVLNTDPLAVEIPHKLHSLPVLGFRSETIQQWESELRERENGERKKQKGMGEGREFGPFKMAVENESRGPAQGEIQRRNTSG